MKIDYRHGGWHDPERPPRAFYAATADLSSERCERLVVELTAAGLMVRERFYVPSARELLGLMRQVSYAMRTTNGVRWVMCAETRDALLDRYSNMRTLGPVEWPAATMADELPLDALAPRIEQAMEDRRYWGGDQTSLFGLPIRIDPAARSPLFEIDSEATRNANA